MKKVLFIDRDGTILVEPSDEQIDSFEKMAFLPHVIGSLARLAAETDYDLVIVSNQDGLGTDSFPEKDFWPVQNKMLDILKKEGVQFADIHIDRSFAHEKLPTRKPGTAMLEKYLSGDYDLVNSFVIGDRKTDIELAQNMGTKCIFLNRRKDRRASLCTTDWQEIHEYLCLPQRKAVVHRKTNETNIRLEINLDGEGFFRLKTGLGLVDHMLELTARHSGIDIRGKISGDLHVDEHHTIEDTAIVLGQAIRQALGNKQGIERYGFLMPMDEAHAQVAIDFSGRAHLNWKVKLKREKLGDVPAEMFHHFFKSFCDHAGCNLYVRAKGKNEHHKIEAVFKGFARALKLAVSRNANEKRVPSTKGLI